MNLTRTKRLLTNKLDNLDARGLLVEVLYASIELLSIEDNDFTWSSWKSQAAAIAEVRSILSVINAGGQPERVDVSVLFAPTGPIQEVSLCSGWAETFLKVAELYDNAEKLIWPQTLNSSVERQL
jgi:hypothetical protein